MMSDDAAYIEEASGAAGALSKMAKLCHQINDQMTATLDPLLGGADNTDTYDASCNTCKSFQRKPFDRKTHLVSVFGFPGDCIKLKKPTTGWPRGQYCGFENGSCYENRRTGKTSSQLKAEILEFRQ